MIAKRFHKLLQLPWLAELIAFAGGVLYLWQLWVYAHNQDSVLDEGAYVYKGWLFVTGRYTPYQPYGPWTNHMPLAFLIPGLIQVLFGPGIRTARYAAIVFAVLTLIGAWLFARRLGNRWWATALVWAMALNSALVKGYSTAVSQGIVACLFTWTLFFTLGSNRPLWQIVLGSFLAATAFMTRINMLPLLPLLVLYIGWEHGVKSGFLSAITMGIVVIFWHALYWPDILQVWARLPRSITPFLDPWRLPPGYGSAWKPYTPPGARWISFFHSIRFHFLSIIGVVTTLVLWPKTGSWKNDSAKRITTFLIVLFGSLFLSHSWAALGKNYCVFCLAGYVSFFTVSGLFVIILAAPSWRLHLSPWLQILLAIFILIASTGLGWSAFEQISDPLYNINLPRWMTGSSLPGFVPLGAVLINKFAIDPQVLRRLLPALFGLITGSLILTIATAITIFLGKSQPKKRSESPSPATPQLNSNTPSWGYWALLIFIGLGFLLTPTPALAGGYTIYDCPGDNIASYETAGLHLAQSIPPGALVYWKGTLSAIPLLYLPNIRIFPPQINDGYSLIRRGEAIESITRFGRWNSTLAQQWAQQADYILIEERSYSGWLRRLVKGKQFQELPPTSPAAACRPDSIIRIFRRLPQPQQSLQASPILASTDVEKVPYFRNLSVFENAP